MKNKKYVVRALFIQYYIYIFIIYKNLHNDLSDMLKLENGWTDSANFGPEIILIAQGKFERREIMKKLRGK